MHAIILSAGRGSRLLPLTADMPKCLLPVGAATVLGHQLDTLFAQGIKSATVVTGFNDYLVQAEIDTRQIGPKVTPLYNPFYQVADNLASCWMARAHMMSDFLIINGDTLFSADLLETVLNAPAKDITVTIDQKDQYDGDDMKVTLAGTQLTAISKTLLARETNGESIGMLRFMNDGTKTFRDELDRMMKLEAGTQNWYLSAIDGLAKSGVHIDTTNIQGAKWAELDTVDDYEICIDLFGHTDAASVPLTLINSQR